MGMFGMGDKAMTNDTDIVVRLCDPWLDISTAPKDGTPIQAEIPGHGSDNIIAWSFGLADANAEICGGWHFIGDKEPPDDWTDGVCWAVNADGRKSTEPTRWKLPPPQGGSDGT